MLPAPGKPLEGSSVPLAGLRCQPTPGDGLTSAETYELFEAIKGNQLRVHINSVWQKSWSWILFLLGMIMGINLRI